MRSKPTLFLLLPVLMIAAAAYFFTNALLPKDLMGSSNTGDLIDFYVYNGLSGENKHIYSRFSQQTYRFEVGDTIEYDVRLPEKVAGAGGIEIYTQDGTYFRDTEGWADQNGIAGHPAADLSAHAGQQWYHRILRVPLRFAGKTAAQWALVGENNDDGRNYRAEYANIVVTDGKGAVKKVIFGAARDFQWDDLSIIDLMNTLSASLSPVAKSGGPLGKPRVIKPEHPSTDIIVASFVATEKPYLADPTGKTDATAAIQQSLTDCYNDGGGTVWLPAGKYKVTGSIHIPSHVTLRGDWRDPDQGSGSYGTVILADVPSGGENAPGLFRIWGSAGVKGLTVYYPQQSAANPLSYPFTFEILGVALGGDGYMSGSVENVTLLNAYRGISAGKDAVHELHAIRGVKGTVLALGIYLQDTADVGKVERIRFNNGYWASLDPSLSTDRPNRAAIDAWTREHGTGMLLGGVEWDQLTEISLSDYALGIGFVQGRRIETTFMMFDIHITNSHVAMRISNLDNRIGLVVANGILQANQGQDPVAIEITNSNGASAIFNHVTIGGGKTAVDLSGSTTAMFINCTFEDWTGPYALTATSGTLAIEGSRFLPALSAEKKGVHLLPGVYSAVLLGNRYPAGGEGFLLENESSADVKRQDEGYSLAEHGVSSYPWRPDLPVPASSRLYNVKQPPYQARADGQSDDTAAIQKALEDAGHSGGGIVFLPAGLYRVKTHLVVPAGVELRGSDASPHRTMRMGRASGSILLAYEGRAAPDPDGAAPLILLDGSSAGVTGLSIHYPEQATSAAEDIVAYPWTIRGRGEGVYAVNISFSNAWRGVDFATYPTDRHYVNQVVGLALKEGIRAGNSAEGWVEDSLFNINAWARARGLPGNLDERLTLFRVAGKYTRANLRAFVVTSGARNEHLLSDFVYGAQAGFTFEPGANAVAINVAADGGVDTLRFSGTGETGVKVINTEGCGCGLEGVGLKVEGGTVGVWNLITMEPYRLAVQATGGSTLLQGAAFQHNVARVEAGEITMNGVLFRDAGEHVTVQGGSVNLWGNMGGRTSFNITGSPASAGCNIRR